MANETSPPSSPAPTALNKRQQVQKANKAIFLWVAIAAAIVTLSLVALQFLVRQAIFNAQIIKEKSATNSTLVQNIENAAQLKKNVDALLADDRLANVKANESDNNLKVILDALPTNGDTTSISNSLYTQVLNRSGITVEAISVGDPAAAAAVAPVAPAVAPVPVTDVNASAAPAPVPVPFTVSARGDVVQATNALLDLQKVIRPFNLTNLQITAADDKKLNLSIKGETYYLQASSVKIGQKELRP